jgi:hypothetical protein
MRVVLVITVRQVLWTAAIAAVLLAYAHDALGFLA